MTKHTIIIEPQDEAPAKAQTQAAISPASMLAGSSRPEPRIDTGTALCVGAAIVTAMIYALGYRRMRDERRQAEAERDTLQLVRRANAQTIRAGLVVRS
jgi:hypothetical protein